MVVHLRLELSHDSLSSPLVLHCVGPDPTNTSIFPIPSGSGPFWYSLRDTYDPIVDGGRSQPSKQQLPQTVPITARLFFNDKLVFSGTADTWSYNDAGHLCQLRFSPDFMLECAEMKDLHRTPFVSYWRDTTEPRYAAMMVFNPPFFSCFK